MPCLLLCMKNLKLIIFDLDGTLVNAYPAIIASFNFVLRKQGYPKQSALIIKRAVGRGDENLIKPYVSPKDFKETVALYRLHHKMALLKKSRLFPGVMDMLGYLKCKGYKLAVASNRPTKFTRILIRHLGIEKYFDYILCGDKLKHMKPHPEMLNKICHRFSAGKSEVLFAGDMTIDAICGRRAGIKTVIVTTGSSSLNEIRKEKPFKIIRKITQLIGIIED